MIKRILKVIFLFMVILSFQCCSANKERIGLVRNSENINSYSVPSNVLDPVEICDGIKIFHDEWQFFELKKNGFMGVFGIFRTEDIMNEESYRLSFFNNLWRGESSAQITPKDAKEYPYSRVMVYCSSLNPKFCKSRSRKYLTTFEHLQDVKYFKHQFFSNEEGDIYFDAYWFGLKNEGSLKTIFARGFGGSYDFIDLNMVP